MPSVSKIPRSRKLHRAFTVAALALGIATAPGFVPQAHAGGSVVAAMSSNHSRQRDDETFSTAIAAPTDENMNALLKRDIVDAKAIPFLREAITEANLPAGHVTPAQRSRVKSRMQEKWRMHYMSAATAEEAISRGLNPKLAQHFSTCAPKASAPVTPEITANAEQCMVDEMWKESVPYLLFMGGVVTCLVAYGAYDKRRRYK